MKRFFLVLLVCFFGYSSGQAQRFSIEAGLTNYFGMPGIVAGVLFPSDPTGLSGGRIQAFFALDALAPLGFIGGTGKTGWVFGARSEVLIGQSLLPLIGVSGDYLGAYAKLGLILMIGNISSAGGGLLNLPLGIGIDVGAGLVLQLPNIIGAFFEIEAGYLLPAQWYANLSFGLRVRIGG